MRPNTRILQGEGPIADRARTALHSVASQFGKVIESTKSTVSVVVSDGTRLDLSYECGNFVFSRVYNLKIVTDLPDSSPAPINLRLSFKHKGEPRFVGSANAANRSEIDGFNRSISDHLRGIDLAASTVRLTAAGHKRLTLTPLGGSFVWVLIPPVFKPIAFPPGEIERIVNLIVAVRNPAVNTNKHTEI